jgi:hypothetical protein
VIVRSPTVTAPQLRAHIPTELRRRRKILVMKTRSKTLLEPGHEAEWASLDQEKRDALRPPPDTPVAELLRRGQHLSAQAGALLRAVERADGSSRP